MEILPHEKQVYEYIKTVAHLKKQNKENPLFTEEIRKLEQKLEKLKQETYSALSLLVLILLIILKILAKILLKCLVIAVLVTIIPLLEA